MTKEIIGKRALAQCLFLATIAFAQEAPGKCQHTVTGDLHMATLVSKVFRNSRTLRIWLPPGYDEAKNSARQYPILYMFDGQNLFDACTAFNHKDEWRIDETLTSLISAGKIAPMIVAGIDNAGARRAAEYLPWRDGIQQPQMDPPEGTLLIDFMLKEVMPYVEETYRVAKGRENTGIGGSSYGGIAALYCGIEAPNVFGKVLAESPVLWVGNGQMLRQTEHLVQSPERVYLGFGGDEIHIPDVDANRSSIRMIRQLEGNLKNSYLSGAEVKFIFDPSAEHNEQAWAKRFEEALTFLYPHSEHSGTAYEH